MQKIAQLRRDGYDVKRNRNLGPTKGVDRPCKLENIYSGRVIASDSLANFCREARLYGNSRYHINPILSGHTLSHKNWYLPEVLHKKLELVDVYGNEYNTTVKELILKYKLSSVFTRRLLEGKSVYGLYPKEKFNELSNQVILPKNYSIKKYVFTNGKRDIDGVTMEKLGKKIDRSIGSIYDVVHGYKENIDGFRLKELVLEFKSRL